MTDRIAFVLSGGGNRGAIEAGALQSLVAHGIQADLLVGTSAGALNGTYYCLHPNARGVQELIDIWLQTRAQDIFPGNIFTAGWRVLTGKNGLVDNEPLSSYVKEHICDDDVTFGDMQIPLYVTTTDLVSAQLVVFGDEPDTRVLEPVVASAAYPIVIEPLLLEQNQLTDGGVLAYAPVEIAAQYDATEAYVIDLAPVVPRSEPVQGVVQLATQVLNIMMRKGRLDDMEDAINAGLKVHHIQIAAFSDLSLFDFSKTRDLIDAGKAALDAYLDHPRPNVVHRPIPTRPAPHGGRFLPPR